MLHNVTLGLLDHDIRIWDTRLDSQLDMSRFSPAAKAPDKGAVTSKTASKSTIQGLCIRPEELPEITHNCWPIGSV